MTSPLPSSSSSTHAIGNETSTAAKDPFHTQMETLTLNSGTKKKPVHSVIENTKCFVCEEVFGNVRFKQNKDALLKHALTEHKLVIADVQLVPYFDRYVAHWREKFREHSILEYCWGIQTRGSKPEIPIETETYYLLCDMLPEDKEIRMSLQHQQLQDALDQHQREKDDLNFSHQCLFCTERFTGSRYKLFEHMTHDHNFHIGRPENLVYTDELLRTLENLYERNTCFFCEKEFKDRITLREHMRKKTHKKINPQNKAYDKYYIINYLEMGKNWEEIEEDPELDKTNDDWSDWVDESPRIVCLFCAHGAEEMAAITQHMKKEHMFKFDAMISPLNFYDRVRVINFIRHQVHRHCCFVCKKQCADQKMLVDHMIKENHINTLPDKKEWETVNFYFPSYEDDQMLCCLDYELDNAVIYESVPNVIKEESEDESIAKRSIFISDVPLVKTLWKSALPDEHPK